MGVHYYAPEEESLIFWQKVWKFFQDKDFSILPEKYLNTNLESSINNYIVPEINGKAKQTISSFQEALTLINELKSLPDLEIKSSEWNFFGKHEDKERYDNYIENIFWSNQHYEELSLIPNYWKVLEYKPLLTNYTSLLPFEIKQPLEFFDEKTLGFLQAIETILRQWSFNPYLSLPQEGTFQWIIKFNSAEISGAIVKKGDHLIHNINFKNFDKILETK